MNSCALLASESVEGRVSDRTQELRKELQRRNHVPVGALAPLHCTAPGKVLLAFGPEWDRQGVPNKEPIESFTRRTFTDSGALRSHLAKVRGLQVAIEELNW